MNRLLSTHVIIDSVGFSKDKIYEAEQVITRKIAKINRFLTGHVNPDEEEEIPEDLANMVRNTLEED
jgi:hypothetical protein